MLIDCECVFALCKYSTSRGLVTNVNRGKKQRFSEVLFSVCSLSLYEYLKRSHSDCTSLATLFVAVPHNHVITLNLTGLINNIKMLFK